MCVCEEECKENRIASMLFETGEWDEKESKMNEQQRNKRKTCFYG